MASQFNKKKQYFGFIYGLIAGSIFALAAWGIDSVLLANSHVADPWIKILPGLAVSTLVGGVIGWAKIKISNGFIGILFWVAFGLFLVWLIIWLPFYGAPAILKLVHPIFVDWINYPEVTNQDQFFAIGLVIIIIPVILCGLMENNLVESMIISSHRGAIFLIILVCGFLMGIAGSAGDELTNKHFREPIRALDELFQFAIKNQGQEIDQVLANRMRMKSVEEIEEILARHRKLTLIAFDEEMAQMDFMVNFEGIYAKCTTIYSQPIQCKLIIPPPITPNF